MVSQEKKLQSGFNWFAVLKGSIIGIIAMLILAFICSVMIIKDVISLNSIFQTAVVIAAITFMAAGLIAASKAKSKRLIAALAANILIVCIFALCGMMMTSTAFSVQAAIYIGCAAVVCSLLSSILSNLLIKG